MVFETKQEWSIEKIWEHILLQLQLEMSRVNFETWVKSAQVMSFDGETFQIGCHNAYARDWLESRIKSTVQRLICGLVNQSITVEFSVIHSSLKNQQDSPVGQKNQKIFCDDSLIEFEPEYASLRDALMEPERVVKLPAYFLRWLPYVGAKTIFELIGFWQEYYLASKGKQPAGGEKVSTRVERVCSWAGVSRAQLFRDLADGQPLAWFLKKIETDFEKDRQTGRAKKSANKYALHGIPLTPGDAEDLKTYLMQNNFIDDPYQVLQTALTLQPNKILQYPFREPTNDFWKMTPQRITVHSVIAELIGRQSASQLTDLADQLADRLLGSGEFVLIRWYFLNQWLPILGHNPAMLVILLRNLCYFNDEMGEIRDDVWIEKGYTEIAARLGLKNPRLIHQWFPAMFERGGQTESHTEKTDREIQRRQRIRTALKSFLERIDYRSTNQLAYGWHFRVQRMDPLIPEHLLIKQAATQLLVRAEEESVLAQLNVFLEWLPNDCIETLKMDTMIVLRRSNIDNACFETLERLLKDCFETVKTLPNGCIETLLKTLKGFKDSIINKDTITNQDSSKSPKALPKSGSGGGDQYFDWCLETLLANINPQARKSLLQQEITPMPYLSWILYGIATVVIQNPVSLAISKLKIQPGRGPGGAYDRIAGLPAEQFIQNLQSELCFGYVSDPDWQTVFRSIPFERKRMLSDILGIPMN